MPVQSVHVEHVHTCPSLFLLSHGLSYFIAKSAGAIRAKSDGTESICVLRLLSHCIKMRTFVLSLMHTNFSLASSYFNSTTIFRLKALCMSMMVILSLLFNNPL